MYKIIGANQVEYGPVTAEQLRQWIVEGRVNAQTATQAVGETTWKPLSSFPEFAASFPGQAAPPAGAAPSPQTPPPGPATAPLTPDAGRARALSEISGPAIGLMVTAGLGIANGLFSLAAVMFGFAVGNFNRMHTPRFQGESPEMARFLQMLQSGAGGVAGSFVHIALGIFILFAALKMKKLESHGLAVAASILALVPCCSPCCCVGIPLGIWALVVLNKSEVKGYFTS
jgi:hypothetical protein